jgi:hypothetical protein
MKSLLSLLFLIFATAQGYAQEKVIYDAHAEKRNVSTFHSIKVSQGITLMLQQGNEEALAISADKKEYGDAVKTEVVNGELRIYIEQSMNKWWQQLRKKGVEVKAYVSFKKLEKLDASSGARIDIQGKLVVPQLSLDLSSGAGITGEVQIAKLRMEQSSGAISRLRGQVQDLTVLSSSGAHHKGYELIAQEGTAHASSGAKIEISVEKKLAVSANSGGAILYKGNGLISSVKTGSGGKVHKVS